MLNQNQFVFRPGRSIVDAILKLTQDIYAVFYNRKVTFAVMEDFEAAFDTIPLDSLIIHKLK